MDVTSKGLTYHYIKYINTILQLNSLFSLKDCGKKDPREKTIQNNSNLIPEFVVVLHSLFRTELI